DLEQFPEPAEFEDDLPDAADIPKGLARRGVGCLRIALNRGWSLERTVEGGDILTAIGLLFPARAELGERFFGRLARLFRCIDLGFTSARTDGFRLGLQRRFEDRRRCLRRARVWRRERPCFQTLDCIAFGAVAVIRHAASPDLDRRIEWLSRDNRGDCRREGRGRFGARHTGQGCRLPTGEDGFRGWR